MEIFEQLSVVVLVLLLLCGLLWALRRRGMVSLRLPGGRNNADKRLQVLERLPLTPSHSLHLVRLADRVLLIGVAPSGCTLLDTEKSSSPAAPGLNS